MNKHKLPEFLGIIAWNGVNFDNVYDRKYEHDYRMRYRLSHQDTQELNI